MDRLSARVLLLALAAIACAPATTAPPTNTPTPTLAVTTRAAATASATPVRAAPPPTAPPPVLTAPTGRTPRPGGCTTAQATTRQLLERYFSLTTSNDVGAVLDCFTKAYREHVDMESSAGRWANAGRITSLRISLIDRVNACDRYEAKWDFLVEDPFHPNPWGIFYSVGAEAGMPRIFDAGTGLTAPEYTIITCG